MHTIKNPISPGETPAGSPIKNRMKGTEPMHKNNGILKKLVSGLCCLVMMAATIPAFGLTASAADAPSSNPNISLYPGMSSYLMNCVFHGIFYDLNTGNPVYCIDSEREYTDGKTVQGFLDPTTVFPPDVLEGLQDLLMAGYPFTTGNGLSTLYSWECTADAVWCYTYLTMGYGLDPALLSPANGWQACYDYFQKVLNAGLNHTKPDWGLSAPDVSLTESSGAMTGQTTVTFNNLQGGYTLDTSKLPADVTVTGYTGGSGDVLTFTAPDTYAGQTIDLSGVLVGHDTRSPLNLVWYDNTDPTLQRMVGVYYTSIDVATSADISLDFAQFLYPYTVNYYRDSVSPSTLIGSLNGTTLFEEGHQLADTDVTADLGSGWIDAMMPLRYAVSMVQSYSVITMDAASNTVDVVYTPAPTFPYKVDYYTDSVDAANSLGSAYGTTQFVIGYQLTETDVTADLGYGWIDAQKPVGYDSGTAQGYPVISTDMFINTVNVVYPRTPTYSYTVNYYTDSAAPANLIGFADGTTYFTAGRQLTQSDVSADLGAGWADAKKPAGYGSSAVQGYPVISTDTAKNTVNVVYQKVPTYPYKVNYYTDSADPANQIGYTDGLTQFAEGYRLTGADVSADLGASWVDAQKPAGYESGAVQGYPVISSDAAQNVISVVYTKTPVYPYAVKYYKDSISAANLVGTTAGISSFTAGYQLTQSDVAADLGNRWVDAQKPAGYDSGAVQGYPVISTDPATNVVNVVYPKTPTYPYTVKYYTGSVSTANLIGATAGKTQFTAGYQLTQTDVAADLGNRWVDAQKPAGYDSGTVQGYPVISTDAATNTVNVVYPKTPVYPYTVKYYKDSVSDANSLGNTPGKTSFTAGHQLTAADVSKDLGTGWVDAKKPTGYNSGTVQGYPVISVDPTKNTVTVIYPKTPVYPYSVNYYKDSVSPDNLIGAADGKTQFTAGYQLTPSDVAADMGAGWVDAQKPAGYDGGEVQGYPVITVDPARNVVNVVYPKTPLYPYTVRYFKDSVSDANLLGSTPGVTSFTAGTTLNAADVTADLGASWMAANKPSGYNSSTITYCTISADPATNIVTVVYKQAGTPSTPSTPSTSSTPSTPANPKTGDSSAPIALYLAIGVVALGGLLVLAFTGKKRPRKK